VGNSSLQVTQVQPITFALRRANGVYKENNCVHRAVITKLLLLQHYVHCTPLFCFYKHQWPDESHSTSCLYRYTTDNVTHLENQLLH